MSLTEHCHVISRRDDRGKINTFWNEQWKPVKKVTVKRECGSQRGYQQVLVLSNLRSPDTGRGGREKPNDWLGPQNGSGPPPPRQQK